MPAKKRWPWVLVVVALAGGAAVLMMMKRNDDAPPTAEPYCAITAPPVLDGSGTGPVLLRYAFVAGQRTEITVVTQTKTSETLANGARTSDDVSITLEGTVHWSAANRGRLEIETVSVDRAKAQANVHWRSDDPVDPPGEYRPLLALRALPVAIEVDPRGEVTAPGIAAWEETLARENASPALRAAMAKDEVFRTMFVRLPEAPVTIGDRWPAGDLVHALPGAGDVRAKLELRIAAISRDGTQIVLDAAAEMQLSGSATVKTRKTALRMWSQFDQKRHDVVASALRACADVELESGIASALELVATYDPHPLGAAPAGSGSAAEAP